MLATAPREGTLKRLPFLRRVGNAYAAARNVLRYGTPYRSRPGRERKSVPFVWPTWRQGTPQWHAVDLASYIREGFNLNAIVYSAIMYKVRALQSVKLRAYTGDPDNPEPVDEGHPLAQLLSRPNVHQSGIEMQGQSIVYLNLDGNAYFYLSREKTEWEGDIGEIYCLRPDRVFIVPGMTRDKRATITGYLYVPEGRSAWGDWSQAERWRRIERGEVMPIRPEDMMHVKLPNPGDPLEGMGYGLSPLSPGAQSADVDNDATKYLKEFFDRGLMPTVAITVPGAITDETADAVREKFKEIYSGGEGWLEPAVFEEGTKLEKLAYTFAELGFDAIDERDESRILGPFGVPPILIGARYGLAHATYSNYEQARKACWQDTLVPETRLFETEFQYYLRSDDAWVAYDYSDVPALQEDIPALVAAWATLVERGVPKDIAAQTVGLDIEALPDGDVVYMPMNLIPVGRVGGPQPAPAQEQEPQPVPAPEPEEGGEAAPEATEDEREEGGEAAPKAPARRARPGSRGKRSGAFGNG